MSRDGEDSYYATDDYTDDEVDDDDDCMLEVGDDDDDCMLEVGDDNYDGEPEDDAGDDDECGLQEAQEKEDVASAMEKAYVILTQDGVRARQEEDVAMVCEVLSVPPGFAAVLLRHFKWSPDLLQEAWFLDERRVRDAVGLAPGAAAPMLENSRRLTCAICCDQFSAGQMRSAGCSHFYCVECWRGYVRAAVVDGPRCLSLRCPDPSCSVAVVRELVDAVAGSKDREWYATFALRSYVEESTRLKWCPGPGCSRAVEFVGSGGDSRSNDVFCTCGHEFCGQCGEQAHRPVSCETVSMWMAKSSSGSATARWLLFHTKHCPECRRPIEKNHGCMHMTCREPCSHEFCWLCLEPWKGHRNCGRYWADGPVVGSKAAENTDEERQRQARASRNRYIYHYERWDANLRSLRVVLDDMEALERSELEEMASAADVPATELGFVTEAYKQVGEGRRVLGWAYAYGYYLDPEHDAAKRRLFDYLQEDANASLERLHVCAEQERKVVFTPGDEEVTVDFDKYRAYREKLAGLTMGTRHYFENLVKAFAGDLAEVSSSS